MSLRLRVALAAGVTSLLVAVAAGVVLLVLVRRDESRALDEQLRRQAQVAVEQAAVVVAADRPAVAERLASRPVPDLNVVARVRVGDEVAVPLGAFPVPEDEVPSRGYSTVDAGDQTWRVLARRVDQVAPALAERLIPEDQRDEAVVEVAAPTDSVEEAVADVRRLVVRLGLAALVIAGVGGWLLGGAALRPLARLRRDADRVSETDDPDARVADDQGLREVDELGRALNEMLDRLRSANRRTEEALDSSRAFAADAAHELRTPLTSMQANLEVLAREQELDATERQQIVGEVLAQEQRLLRLLEGLRLLARGDLTSSLPTDEVEVHDVVDEAVAAARRRHPDATIDVRTVGDGVELVGWREGLRVLVDNLLDNAAVHGAGSAGPAEVAVTVDTGSDEVRVVVDDAGPGLAEDDRARVLERFARGRDAAPGGSGLGLALVAQQAALHGGGVELATSPTGGLRVVVRLPVRRAAPP